MNDRVTDFFKQKNLRLAPLFTGEDTSTVQKAAAVLGVEDGQIAKSLAVKLPPQTAESGVGVLVTMGTARLDNQKFKAAFGIKASMLGPQETLAATGYAVGGVCPFALPAAVPVYLDESLRRYEFVYPAAGTRDSAVKVAVAQLAGICGGVWVDVCKAPQAAAV